MRGTSAAGDQRQQGDLVRVVEFRSAGDINFPSALQIDDFVDPDDYGERKEDCKSSYRADKIC
jgi:hypothetical protein